MDDCPLNSGLRKRAVAVVREFIEMSFIPKMKEHDALFGNLYFGIYYAGSYYDDLRIVEPTKFDLDIKLKIPFHGRLVKQGFGNGLPIPSVFARYYCSSPPRDVKLRKKLTEDQKKLFLTFFEENILLPVTVRNWFRKVVDKTLKYYQSNPSYIGQNCLTIRRCKWIQYSPASTLKIKVDRDFEVDIDLVPVFPLGEETLVPKTYPDEKYQKVWRLSFVVFFLGERFAERPKLCEESYQDAEVASRSI